MPQKHSPPRQRIFAILGATCVACAFVLIAGLILEPSDPLVAEASRDPRLVAWLKDLERRPQVDPSGSAGRRVALADLLENTSLDCRSLIEIGQTVHTRCTSDDLALSFYVEAIKRAERELPALAPDSPAARSILLGLSGTKNLFWRAIDRDRSEYLKPLYNLDVCLIRYGERQTPEIQDARRKAMVGKVECLMLTGHGDAVRAALAIDTTGMTSEEKLSVAFVRGEALHRDCQPSEAIPYLRQCASAPRFRSQKPAMALLCEDLIKTGKRTEAASVYKTYVHKYGADATGSLLKAGIQE